jgi:hypothetical protein
MGSPMKRYFSLHYQSPRSFLLSSPTNPSSNPNNDLHLTDLQSHSRPQLRYLNLADVPLASVKLASDFTVEDATSKGENSGDLLNSIIEASARKQKAFWVSIEEKGPTTEETCEGAVLEKFGKSKGIE